MRANAANLSSGDAAANSKFRLWCCGFALAAFLIGASGLAGWIFDNDLLKRLHPTLVAIKANTAVCLMLAAASLLLQVEPATGLRRRIAQAFAAIIAVVGALTLLEHFFRFDFHIDQLLFHESAAEAGQSFPGRMGVAASLNFIFLGMALMFLDAKPGGEYWPSSSFASAAVAVTLLVFLYYFYGVEKFEAIAFYATIALNTVIAFLCLCVAILFVRPDRGILATLRGDNVGSVVARRLLPVALFVPVFFGWLRVLGQRAGLFGTGFGTAIYCGLLVLIFTTLIWRTAVALNRIEARRRRIEETLRERETVLQTVTNEARVGLVMVDKERRYLFANQAYLEIMGLLDVDIVGKRVADVLAPVYDQISPRLDRAFAGERVNYELHMPVNPRTRSEHFYEVLYEPHLGGEPYIVVVITDITERKNAERDLERLVAERTSKLRETVQELEGFSYSITHDLRAPLRAMQSYAHLLQESGAAKLDDTENEFLRRIGVSACRMDELIQDVLNYSRVLQMDLALEPVDAAKLLRGMIETYPDFQEPKATIVIEGELPVVFANEAALTQCFSNLLNNAVKFVPTGVKPRVIVRAERKKSTVRFWIEDNGIGIEPKYLNEIFGMFQRLQTSYEGTGIGLAIVRKAAERMGGQAGAESEPGKGSRFWFELKPAGGGGERA